MRVIGGKLKGRKFYPPAKNWPTRPTTDFAKESLFNILNNLLDFSKITALDLFGGTGSHSFELISRGCQWVYYVDQHYPCVKFVRQTTELFGMSEEIKISKMDASKFIRTCSEQFDYIFAGPPYSLPWLRELPDLIFKYALLKDLGVFVLEHNPEYSFKDDIHFVEQRKYGSTIFSFFKN